MAPVIAFFGLFGVGNIGNEASLSSAVAAVRRLDPAADMVAICDDTDAVREQHGIDGVSVVMNGPLPDVPRGPRMIRIVQKPVFELSRWISAYRFLRRVDLVICPGTGALDDYGCSPRDAPYRIFRWTLAAKLARKPFALLSVGAGPITHPVSRFLMKNAVKFSTYCSYRDDYSRAYMAGLGASTMNAAVKPDLVFALPCPNRFSTSGTIGLGVMNYRGWNDPDGGEEIFRRYIANMSEIASRILASGESVRILIGDEADECAVDALLEDMRERRGIDCDTGRVIVEPIESMEDLLLQIVNTDGVIATRFHNVVGALMVNRPVIALGYNAKFDNVMASAGLNRFSHDAESFTPEVVMKDLDELLANWREYLPVVDASVQQMRDELAREFDAVIGGHIGVR